MSFWKKPPAAPALSSRNAALAFLAACRDRFVDAYPLESPVGEWPPHKTRLRFRDALIAYGETPNDNHAERIRNAASLLFLAHHERYDGITHAPATLAGKIDYLVRMLHAADPKKRAAAYENLQRGTLADDTWEPDTLPLAGNEGIESLEAQLRLVAKRLMEEVSL